MRIVRLLEGSELLYHVTDMVSMRGILKLGGLQLSDLRFSDFERGVIDDLFPDGLSESGLPTGTAIGHKLRMVLRSGGIKDRGGIYDLMDRIMGEEG